MRFVVIIISFAYSFSIFSACHLGSDEIANIKQCDFVPVIIGDGQTKISEKKFQTCSRIKLDKPLEWTLVNENGVFSTRFSSQVNKLIDDRKVLEKFETDYVVREIEELDIPQEEKYQAYQTHIEDLRKRSMFDTNLYTYNVDDSGVLSQFNILLKKDAHVGQVTKFEEGKNGDLLNDGDFKKFISVNSSSDSYLIKKLLDTKNTDKKCYRVSIGSFVKVDCTYMGKSFSDYEKKPVMFNLVTLVDKDLKIVFEPGYTNNNGIHFDPHYEMIVEGIPYLVFTYTPAGQIYFNSVIGYFFDDKFYMTEIHNQCNDLDYQFRLC
tara:strand:- start:1345 stop:2310 length:966 start_codon:yes stop_codon:yes gene_type:complete